MAEEWHILPSLFRRFLKAAVTRPEAQQIVGHIIGGCDRCGLLVKRLVAHRMAWRPPSKSTTGRELSGGWDSWLPLALLPPEERRSRLLADATLHTLTMHECLLEAGSCSSREKPVEGVEIIALALHVAERLDPEQLGGQLVHEDILAEAHAALGNARRLAADFDGSRRALNDAWRHLRNGTREELTKAHLISLDASWLIDMGEFERAEAALEEALQIYCVAHDCHKEGRTLLQMAAAIGYVDPRRGINYLTKALPLIDANSEPRLELCAHHDLAWFLTDLGKANDALAILNRARPLYERCSDDWAQLRLRWLEGRIARAFGNHDEAEVIFRHLRHDARARDLHHEFTLLSLDLVESKVAKGDFKDAAEIAAEVYPLMAAWGLHRHAMSAWLFLQRALTRGYTAVLFKDLNLYFRRYWRVAVEFAPGTAHDESDLNRICRTPTPYE